MTDIPSQRRSATSSSGSPVPRTTSCSTCRAPSWSRSPSRRPLATELVGWPYHQDRDLTGFEDGTENPTLVEATSAAIIDAGSPGEGGSVLLLQQWEHDAAKWELLPVEEQEQAMGRTEARQRGARPEAARLPRRAHRPGLVRQDLPAQHRLRHPDPTRHHLRGLQPGPRSARCDAPEHVRRSRRRSRPPHALHACPDGCLLLRAVGRRARGVRGRGPGLTQLPAHAAARPRGWPARRHRWTRARGRAAPGGSPETRSTIA